MLVSHVNQHFSFCQYIHKNWHQWWMVGFMLFNATFNNISVISWRSVLLVEDPEKTTDLSQVTDKLYHIMLYTSPWSRFELTTTVVIGTDCLGSCKSNYHMITATTSPTPMKMNETTIYRFWKNLYQNCHIQIFLFLITLAILDAKSNFV